MAPSCQHHSHSPSVSAMWRYSQCDAYAYAKCMIRQVSKVSGIIILYFISSYITEIMAP